MALDIFKEKGVSLDRQVFTWKDLVRRPYSKLDDDAFTRVRVILMNGIESDSVRFKHILNRMSRELREPLALVRRVEHHGRGVSRAALDGGRLRPRVPASARQSENVPVSYPRNADAASEQTTEKPICRVLREAL